MSQSQPPEPPLPESPRVSEALFAARTVLIMGEVTSALAQRVTAQLLALASQSDAPIRVFVHSPGGHVESGDTIHDVIRFIDPPVLMLGSGWVASAGALIFAAVERSQRVCLPNTRFLLHEPSGGFGGQAADIEIEARQVVAMRARLNAIFARATGQAVDKITRDSERNHWLNAEEALAYGLVGRIAQRAADLSTR